MHILIVLDSRLEDTRTKSSSRVRESMLRSLSVPNSLCAFERFGDVTVGDSAGRLALVVEVGFRPGIGKENLDVRPIVSLRQALQEYDVISSGRNTA